MGYTVVLAETDAHREALARIWTTNSYDPAVNPYARERFDWLYREPAVDKAQTWLAIETASQAVIGCGSGRTIAIRWRPKRPPRSSTGATADSRRTTASTAWSPTTMAGCSAMSSSTP